MKDSIQNSLKKYNFSIHSSKNIWQFNSVSWFCHILKHDPML